MTSVKSYTALAFDTLNCRLTGAKKVSLRDFRKVIENTDEPEHPEAYPLFVTWNVAKHGHNQLRGCIGNFSDLMLPSGVEQYALIAAQEDPRFSPIRERELSKLSCTVTLLKKFEKVKDIYDWDIGRHGIRIYINGQRSATFLPDVPVEQEWSKEQTLQALVEKAGFYQDYTQLDIRLTRYQGIKESLTYEEYMDLREKALL